MAVLREDVVSIGFDVPENPFADLTAGIEAIKMKLGVVDEAEAGIQGLGKEADITGKALSDMGNGIHAPPAEEVTKSLKETQKEAQKTEVTFTGLLKTMKVIGGQKWTGGVEKLTGAITKPVKSIQNLAKGVKDASAYIKEVGWPHAFNAGLGNAVTGTGKLLGKLKAAGAVSLKTAISGMKFLASHAASAAKALGSKAWSGMKALGKGAAVGIAAAGTALSVGAVAAFNFGAAYETSLAKVSTIADTAAVSMADLSTDVLKLSNATGEDAAGLNEAVYQALSAGADTAGVVGLVNTAVKAAKGGYTDTTTAIDGLTSTLNAYGMETKDAEGLANQFLITQNKGKTTFGELASSIGGVAPTANAAGVGVDQLLAGVASLTANGIGTSEAMTGIKAALSNVIKPSSEAAKVAKKLGLNFSTSALQSKGLAGFLDDVKTATGGNMDTMAQLFGSVEALNTVLTLTSDQGSQLMNDTLAEMTTNTTALDNAYNTMADTAQNSVNKGLNSFKNLGIGLYQANEGPVAELTGLFASSGQELYDAFAKGGMEGLTGQIGNTVTGVLTKLTGYLPDIVDSGVQIIDSLVNGIVSNQDEIVGSLTKGASSLIKGVVKIAPKLFTAGAGLLTDLAKGAAEGIPQMIPVVLEAVQTIADGLIQDTPTLVQSGVKILHGIITGILQAAPILFTAGAGLLTDLAEGVAEEVPKLIPAALEAVQTIADGLIQNVPVLIQSGLTILDSLITGLLQAAPMLVSTGVSLIQNIVLGLLNSVDQIINGAVNLVLALATGILSNLPLIIDAAVQLVTGLVTGLVNNINLVIDGALSLVEGLLTGIITNLPAIVEGAVQIIVALAGGLIQAIPQLIAAIPKLVGAIIDTVMNTNWLQVGLDIVKGIGKGLLGGIKSLFSKNKDGGKEITESLSVGLTEGAPLVETSVDKTAQSITTKIDNTDLYGSGQNIMTGLNDGMLKMQPTLNATAGSIGTGISKSLNGSLDIHSPSGVTEETGEYTGLGLVKGMENVGGKVKSTARTVGDVAARNIAPYKSRYSPETSQPADNSSSSQINNWNPIFNLTLNGASASDSNERKVKRWVKESLKEAMEGMGRTNPRLQEV